MLWRQIGYEPKTFKMLRIFVQDHGKGKRSSIQRCSSDLCAVGLEFLAADESHFFVEVILVAVQHQQTDAGGEKGVLEAVCPGKRGKRNALTNQQVACWGIYLYTQKWT